MGHLREGVTPWPGQRGSVRPSSSVSGGGSRLVSLRDRVLREPKDHINGKWYVTCSKIVYGMSYMVHKTWYMVYGM